MPWFASVAGDGISLPHIKERREPLTDGSPVWQKRHAEALLYVSASCKYKEVINIYRVMIVEDEMFVRIGMERSIDWGRYEMEVSATASNGVTAYELYQEVKPHLVITDIKMPKMDGIELITKIRQQDKNVKLIILTCMEDFKTAKSALDNAVSFYFVKDDIRMDDMENAVKAIYEELKKTSVGNVENNSAKGNWEEELRGYLMNTDGFPADGDFDLTPLQSTLSEESSYFTAVFQTATLNQESTDLRHQRFYQSVIQVLEELLRKKKAGCVLFSRQDRVYVLYTLKPTEGLQQAWEYSAHIASMLHSYFNLTTRVLIGESFRLISNLKATFQRLLMEEFSLFYILEPVIAPPHTERLCTCRTIVQTAVQELISFCKENFDRESFEPFFEYPNMLTDPVIQDINRCKIFFTQWFQLYMALTQSISEQLRQCQFEAINEINDATVFTDMTASILGFMKKEKEDKDSRQQISAGLAKAIHFIHLNLNKPLTLPQIAESANFSAGYLSYLFTKEMGMSFSDFLLKLRIKTAKIMLAQTDDKLYVIAEAIGFSDPGYFNKVFRKHTGITPSQYRKKNYREFGRFE